jgi:hypothetical protein
MDTADHHGMGQARSDQVVKNGSGRHVRYCSRPPLNQSIELNSATNRSA